MKTQGQSGESVVRCMTIGGLRGAIQVATEQGGAWGKNMHPSKDVLLRIDGVTYPLASVSASFIDGRFVLVLDGESDGAES